MINGWVGRQTDGWVDGWMDNEWTDGWMWTDGYLDAEMIG